MTAYYSILAMFLGLAILVGGRPWLGLALLVGALLVVGTAMTRDALGILRGR